MRGIEGSIKGNFEDRTNPVKYLPSNSPPSPSTDKVAPVHTAKDQDRNGRYQQDNINNAYTVLNVTVLSCERSRIDIASEIYEKILYPSMFLTMALS